MGEGKLVVIGGVLDEFGVTRDTYLDGTNKWIVLMWLRYKDHALVNLNCLR